MSEKSDKPCSECGEVGYGLNYLNRKELEKRGVCFPCNFWLEHIEKPSPHRVITDGVHQIMGDESEPRGFRGCGGAKFKIEFLDGRRVETTNLWVQGRIPLRFRDRLPDNARFVKDAP